MNPIFIAVTVALIVAQFALPRRLAFLPLLVAIFHLPNVSVIGLGAGNFPVTRLLVGVGLISAVFNRRLSWTPRHAVDRWMGGCGIAAILTSPANVNFSATASDSDGTITKVEFFSGGAWLGEDTSSPYVFGWSGVPAGSYTVTAKATDNVGAMTISSTVSITVVASPPPGTFKVGDRVTVSSSPSVRVRSTAAQSGNVVGEQLQGARGTIIAGPVSADGYTWWQIDYDSAPDGWLIEVAASEIWLTPIPTISRPTGFRILEP